MKLIKLTATNALPILINPANLVSIREAPDGSELTFVGREVVYVKEGPFSIASEIEE